MIGAVAFLSCDRLTYGRGSIMPEIMSFKTDTRSPAEIHADDIVKMNKLYEETGKWIDPQTGKEFPPGVKLCPNPNRAERRRLERWRATGKADITGTRIGRGAIVHAAKIHSPI